MQDYKTLINTRTRRVPNHVSKRGERDFAKVKNENVSSDSDNNYAIFDILNCLKFPCFG